MKRIVTFIFSLIMLMCGLWLHGSTSYAVDQPALVIPVSAVLNGSYRVELREADALALKLSVDSPVAEIEELTLDADDRDKLMRGADLTTVINVGSMRYDVIKDVVEQTGQINNKEKTLIYDLSVTVYEAQQQTSRGVVEINSPLTFSFLAPDNFDEQSAKDAKMFNVHKISDDTYRVQILPIIYDKAQKRISFSTQTFSAFVLSYQPHYAAAPSAPSDSKPASSVKTESTTEHHESSSSQESSPTVVAQAPQTPAPVLTAPLPAPEDAMTVNISTNNREAATGDDTEIATRMLIIGICVMIIILLLLSAEEIEESSKKSDKPPKTD